MCQSKAQGGRRCPSSDPAIRRAREIFPSYSKNSVITGDNMDTSYQQQADEYVSSLSTEEKKWVESYVNQDYEDINNALWNDQNHEGIEALDSALSKAPGIQKTLYRKPAFIGNREDIEEEVSRLKAGETITCKGYSSTSENPNALLPLLHNEVRVSKVFPPEDTEEFIKEHDKTYQNVVYEIVTDKGCPVSPLSHMPQEQEWLLPRNQKFKVVRIYDNVEMTSSVRLVDNTPQPPVSKKVKVVQMIPVD